jgi:ribosomal protein S18 acetylase RimI-like enzyme
MLFVGVGLPWRWYSRLSWSTSDWEYYFANNRIKTYLAFGKTSLVGYFELAFHQNNAVEITFFGLFQSSIGEGYGGALLSHAVNIAWNSGVDKVWLHTCTVDHESALSNYKARGFKIVNETVEEETFPDKEDYLKLVNEFMSGYIDSHNHSWN